jgi:hypothetical protein
MNVKYGDGIGHFGCRWDLQIHTHPLKMQKDILIGTLLQQTTNRTRNENSNARIA